jgi:hypothetical protein
VAKPRINWKVLFAQIIGSIIAVWCFLAQMIAGLSLLRRFIERLSFETESDIHPFIYLKT